MAKFYKCQQCGVEFENKLFKRNPLFHNKDCYLQYIKIHGIRSLQGMKSQFIREEIRSRAHKPKEPVQEVIPEPQPEKSDTSIYESQNLNSDIENNKKISLLAESFFRQWIDTDRNAVPKILSWLNGCGDVPTPLIKLPNYQKTCPSCGMSFSTKRYDQIFCDDPACVRKVLPPHAVCLRSNGKLVLS